MPTETKCQPAPRTPRQNYYDSQKLLFSQLDNADLRDKIQRLASWIENENSELFARMCEAEMFETELTAGRIIADLK